MPLSSDDERKLQKLLYDLLGSIDPPTVTTFFIQNSIFDLQDQDHIAKETDNRGKAFGTMELLQKYKKNAENLELMVEALVNIGQQEIAEKLKNEMEKTEEERIKEIKDRLDFLEQTKPIRAALKFDISATNDPELIEIRELAITLAQKWNASLSKIKTDLEEISETDYKGAMDYLNQRLAAIETPFETVNLAEEETVPISAPEIVKDSEIKECTKCVLM